uniref:Uncharacterized protein n=1 Tax=Anopheles merus TaxID=30066 RepID=A0A182UWJ7_ANOME
MESDQITGEDVCAHHSVYTPVFKFDVIIEPIPLLAMPSPCGTDCSPGAGIIIGCPTPTGPTSERDVARSSSSDDRPGPGPFGAIVTIGISSCPTPEQNQVVAVDSRRVPGASVPNPIVDRAIKQKYTPSDSGNDSSRNSVSAPTTM